MKGYKGFDKNLQCRGLQYEKGKTYKTEGKVKCCENGYHSCENPMDVLGYYQPSDSRYCEVEASGDIDRDGSDSKIASSEIHIGVEIGLKGLIEAGVKFIFDKVDWKNAAATNTGYQSAATVEGKESIACGLGIENKAKGALGCWIVLAEWEKDSEYSWHIKHVKSVKVDGESIKPDTFYMLEKGEFIAKE